MSIIIPTIIELIMLKTGDWRLMRKQDLVGTIYSLEGIYSKYKKFENKRVEKWKFSVKYIP